MSHTLLEVMLTPKVIQSVELILGFSWAKESCHCVQHMNSAFHSSKG